MPIDLRDADYIDFRWYLDGFHPKRLQWSTGRDAMDAYGHPYVEWDEWTDITTADDD